MDGSSDGIRGGPVGPVGILQGVDGVRYAALNVGQHHSLETLHNDWGECHWPVVIQAGGWAPLRQGDDGRGLKARWYNALAEGEVENGGEDINQLVSTCSEDPPGNVVWSCCFAGVDLPQSFVYLVC